MTYPIQENTMFATPDSMDSLMSWIQGHTGSERAVAATAAGMAWNLAAKLLAEQEAHAQTFNEEVRQAREDAFDAWDHWSPGDL